ALGNPKEALLSFLQATSIWERELGDSAPILAYSLTGTGIAYLAENEPGRALLPLERASMLRSAKETDPGDRAETSLALARALWESRRDMVRARQLAEEARGAYAKTSDVKGLAAADSWLREHQPSRLN
ncbi:MAG TPA: hypothetical protein VH853_25925, partial [Polyangia bacterium]|nr:hypothetical protein [Polyangia bacterium]